jgi:hypothetical protein
MPKCPTCDGILVKEVTISEFKDRYTDKDPIMSIHVEKWHCPKDGYWKDEIIQESSITGPRADFTKDHPYSTRDVPKNVIPSIVSSKPEENEE